MARFKLDREGLAELEQTVRLGDYADSIAAEAKLIAPVGKPPDDEHPGAYKASIRPVGEYIYAGSDVAYYAWMLEYGTVDTPVFATLRRATRIAGLRMEENKRAEALSVRRQALAASDLTPAQKREASRDLTRADQREQRRRRRR
jgi:hypothetical protein